MISNEIELTRLKNIVGEQRKQIEDLLVKVMKLEQNNNKKQFEVKDSSYECNICDGCTCLTAWMFMRDSCELFMCVLQILYMASSLIFCIGTLPGVFLEYFVNEKHIRHHI